VYQLLLPPAKLKKLPEHSQSVELFVMFGKDLDIEGSGSITSSESRQRRILKKLAEISRSTACKNGMGQNMKL
jgi:hypothetical protein